MFSSLSVLLALVLDYFLEEPKRWHPLVGFGSMAAVLESAFNTSNAGRLLGVFCWAFAVLPVVWLAYMLEQWLSGSVWLSAVLGALVIYFSVGWQSLLNHGMAVAYPLSQGNIIAARDAVSRMVSRDTEVMDEVAIASAATESILENGADAIFSALFWFMVGGIPAVVLYRLSNTLDAMWGYKNERFQKFGWCAARVDDILNFIPARLTALSYLLAGRKGTAWQAWRQQGRDWKSPNAGPVMASGAGAINIRLGGAACYHGVTQVRSILGPVDGDIASAYSIVKACRLVNRALVIWCVGLFMACLF